MSIDTLFNTSWQVLIGVAALWWAIFAGLLLQQRNATANTVRDRLEILASRFSRCSQPSTIVNRWFSNLGPLNLTFTIIPDPEIRLLAFKWFLGGLLVTGLIPVGGQLIMFGSDSPPPAELHASRLLAQASLITSGLIAAATLVTGLVCGAPRALRDLAKPRNDI